MKKQIKTILEELNNCLEYKKVKDKEVCVFRDDASESIKNNFRDFIHGTEFMPCDYRFNKIQKIVEILYCDYDFDSLNYIKDNLQAEIVDGLIDIYNQDLSNWLASNLLRQNYCNEAIELEMNSKDIISILQCGQYLELDELFNGVISYIENELMLLEE